MDGRHLDLEGCFNARDLGGLPTRTGQRTCVGAAVRSDALDHLTEAGWAAVVSHGVRTIIDLRNDNELTPDAWPRPAGLTTIHIALDGVDPEFWAWWGKGPRFATPLYYQAHLARFPELSAQVVGAFARAEPGGVLIHCGVGRDRTGLIALLLLALVGVDAETIADDHGLSNPRLPPLLARRGERNYLAELDAFLEGEGTTSREVVLSTLAALDVEAQLRRGGLTDADLEAARARLLG